MSGIRETRAPAWMPIATAPKDGTVFLIACVDESERVYEIGWYEPYHFKNYVRVEGHEELFRLEKTLISDWAGFDNFHRATHWMPLPEPPVSE